MIKLSRLSGTELLINEDFIETVEQTPDTVLTMQNGHRYFIKETVDQIISLSEEYQRRIRFNIENNQQ